MFPIKNKKRISEGSVAIFALFLMFILAAATIGIITAATIERRVSISTGNSTTAFQIAESGMEKTLQFFKSNFDKKLSEIGSCSGGSVIYSSNNTIRFKDNATVPAYITDCNELISKVKIIKSIGTTKQETRAIEEDVFLGATKLLLHLNGKNDSDKFEDSSFYYYKNEPITTNGDVSVSTSESKFGRGSAKFDGTTGYLSVPDSTDWDFGSGNFTVDLWVQTNNYNNLVQQFVGQRITNSTPYFLFYIDTNGNLKFLTDSAGTYTTTSALSWNNNQWYHVAFVRSGSTFYIFRDGVSLALTEIAPLGTLPNVAGILQIGSQNYPNNTQFFNGWMDELRISKDIVRWTADFTPPTKEYWPD
jgi:hypothetical protein